MKGGMKRSGATLEEMKQALEGKLFPREQHRTNAKR